MKFRKILHRESLITSLWGPFDHLQHMPSNCSCEVHSFTYFPALQRGR